jgi:fibronectin-binding autotransporter adhesin
MELEIRKVIMGGLLAAAAVLVPSPARAQNPPSGAIFDLSNTPEFAGGALPGAYTQFTASFVADSSSEYVSFAFRDVPDFFSFDDASVVDGASVTNLLADPGFETATVGQNCNHDNSLGCPDGWGAWIQSVDTSFIGSVQSNSTPGGCTAANSGTTFWCDGSVEGYDAVYQQLTGLIVGDTYNVSWFLTEGGNTITNPTTDMLVYAGDTLPVGSIPIGSAPEPATFALVGLGMVGVGVIRARRRKKV